MRLVWGTVTAVLSVHSDALRLEVRLDTGHVRSALAYPALGGACGVSDRVLVNTTAQDLGLGTGGTDLVIARLAPAGEATGEVFCDSSAGHIMKLRYTPLQRDVLAVEERKSPHHDAMASALDLQGMPVVCCGLHSHVVPVSAAIKERARDATVAYVMTDEATLALAMSDTVRASRDAGLLDVTITCGQCFGGDYEAVNLYSGLLAARHVAHADAAVVAIGPGVAGTGTPFGHGGVAQGLAVNAAGALGGDPFAVLRVSFADDRLRHRGVSHHTLTALGRVALTPCRVAVPRLGDEEAALIDSQLAEEGIWRLHERIEGTRDIGELPDFRGVPATTMGRTPADDPAFYAAAVAAGDAAAVR